MMNRDVPDDVYADVAIDTFDLLESFALELIPLLWSRETTIPQLQISTLVLARQLRGKATNVARLALELERPRSTVQNSVNRLIDRGMLVSDVDPDDARRRRLRVPVAKAAEIGDMETILVRYRYRWHQRLAAILKNPESSAPDDT